VSHSTISLGLGLGGGKAATSSGAPGGGGAFANTLSCAFDATAPDSLHLASDETFSGVYSLSLWFKPTDRKNFQTLAWGTGNNYVQLYGPDFSLDEAVITRGFATITSGAGVYDFDAWNHFMLVRDSSNLVEAWVNTSSIGSRSKSGDVALTTLGVYGTSSDTFGGLIDEVAIWDSDQSSNLPTIYGDPPAPADLTALSPLSWWRMGETNPDSAGEAVQLITDVQGRNNFAQADASLQPVLSTDVKT
jgi:hypothetical protein